jgi:predicted  nucleic acid-binding Zn-ribbon protein
MEGLGDGDVYDQTGIEASYSTTLLGGANATKDASTLNKDNMTVRKLYGADAKGTYKSSDFYVMRSQKYDDEVKGKTFANYTTEGNINTIKDAETEKMLAFYKDEDGVQVNDTDVKNGAVTVTVVVLQSITADGKTYYLAKQNQDDSASMLTYTCEVTIPVKQYSEFNLFNDVYGGDFSKITQAISDAQAKNDKLQADLTAKEAEATKLQTQLDAINKKLSEAGITPKTDDNGNVDVSGAVETLESQKADLEKQIKDLKAQIGVSDDTDVAALKAQITTLKKQSDDYASLLSQYQSVIEKLQAGKGPVASDVKSDTITTGDVTVTNDVPAGTYVYGDDGKWHEGSKDGKVVDGITTGDKTPNSGDSITVKVNDKPALTEDELKTLDGSNVIDTLEAQLAEQKQKTAAAEANYKALKDQTDKSAAEAQENLEEAQKQQAEIQSQLEAAKKAKEEADKTLNDANATAEEKQAALQKQVDTLDTRVEFLTKTNKEQGDKLTELQGNVASLGAQVSQYKDVADTVASIAGIDVKGKSAAEVKEALSTMANEYVADKKAITTIAEKAGVDPTTVASDPDAFAKTVSDKIDGSGSPLTDTERKSLNDKIAELTKQNTELQSKINGSGNNGGSSSDTADVTTLRAQLAAAQTQADTYKAQADTYKDLYNTAAKSNGTSAEDTAKIASLTTENATLTSKNKSLSDTNDKLTEQNSSLAETNESLTEKNSSLAKTNKSLKSSNSSLKKQLSAARKNSGKTKTITKKVPVTKVQTVTEQVPVTKVKTVTKEVPVTKVQTVTKTVPVTDTSKSNDSDKKDDSQSHGSVSLGNQGGTPTDTDNKGTITTPDADTQSSSDNDLPDASSSSTSTSSSSGDQGTDPTATPGNGDNSLGSGSEGTVNDGSNKKPKNTSWIYILVAAAAGLAALGGLYMVKAKKPQSASANDYDADIDDDDIDDDDDDDDTDDDE